MTVDAAPVVLEALESKSCLAVGPGLGTSGTTVTTVHRLLAEADKPVVVDADGLNALIGHLELLRQRPAATVLTPHPGEAARLFATDVATVQADRVAFVREQAREHRVVLLLKGHQSLVASPEGDVWINSTGNPGLATGGTGDVLTGLIAGLLARGYDPVMACRLGALVHGLAADLALGENGVESFSATDLLQSLPEAFAELRSS